MESDDAHPLGAFADVVLRGLRRAPRRPEAVRYPPAGQEPTPGQQGVDPSGLALYRVRCGDCHGLDARGYRGPDLTAVLGGMPDERLFQTIRKGVPGTEMPPSTAPDDDVLMIIAYLRDMNAGGPAEAGGRQRRQRGEAVRGAMCVLSSRRHQGGRLGPDLSRVGAARSRAALVREIRTPSEWIPPALRDGDAGDKRRPEDSRRQEERRCVLDPDHGHARAHPGSPAVGAAAK